MIIGAHIMLQSTNDKADMKFLTDVLKLTSVNAGGGFMIFGIPPAEVAVHGSDKNNVHELYFMCDNIAAFTGDMTKHGIAFTTPANRGWGTVTEITLPSGGKLGVYQPHHPRPKAMGIAKAEKRITAKKPAKKKTAKKTANRKGSAKKKRR
jgi:hypothetical protein